MEDRVRALSEAVRRVVGEVERKIVGKRREIELILATLLSEGHVLLEGVPGVAKTLLAKTVASALGLRFKRVQSTPDMLPSDIIGVMVYDPRTSDFSFRRGPVFTNVLFVDEINRAPPKTQSALLEAMQERQVTVEGVSHSLPRPFLVIATMNPIETEGTFPMSEAQVDRFLAKVEIGYPSASETVAILDRYYEITSEPVKPVLEPSDVTTLIEIVKEVSVDQNVKKYISAIVQATREHPMVKLGASPRGAIAMYLLSKAVAVMRGRDYVTPDDVKYVAQPALSHRLILRTEARISGVRAENVVADALERVEVP